MATALGIWNHITAEGQTQKRATPMDSTTNGTSGSSSSGDSASISANDFLVLLVTEMKNQDPTANTDPNEYINQLVQVNSLQQLISINQTLTADSNGSAAATESKRTQNGVAAPIANGDSKSRSLSEGTQRAVHDSAATQHQSTATGMIHSASVRRTAGNLSLPEENPAAQRLAKSLTGQMPKM